MSPAHAEIAQLHASYSYFIDHGLTSEFADLFAPEGGLGVAGQSPLLGRAALEEFARTARRGTHTCGPARVEPDGTAWTTFLFTAPESGGLVSGYYHDSFARSGAGILLFDRRVIEILIRWPNPTSG